MSRIAKTLGVGIAATGLLLEAAGIAAADEQSYLNDARANGVPNGWPATDYAVLLVGRTACDDLHSGRDPYAWGGNYLAFWNAAAIASAQRELCPDTLAG